jgi:hypothetical protein
MALFCLLGAIALVILGSLFSGYGKASHYSQWRELVHRGAIVKNRIEPQHLDDPIARDGSYDIEERVERMGSIAELSKYLGWIGAGLLFVNAVLWLLSSRTAPKRD